MKRLEGLTPLSETKLKLRKTAFGGFARQDVVDYIEGSAREYAAQLNALRAELKEAQEQVSVLEGEKARADGLQERVDILTRRLDDLTPVAESVPGLIEEANRCRPDAESYRRLKDKVADIELQAQDRAAQIVQKAQADADETLQKARAQAEQVLQEARAEAEQTRAEAQSLLDQVTAESNRMSSGANSALSDVIDKLAELRDSFTVLSALKEDLKS